MIRDSPSQANKRRFVAFLLDHLHGYQAMLWKRAFRTTSKQNVTLVTFVGDSFLHEHARPDEEVTSMNRVFDFALAPWFESTLIAGVSLGSFISLEEYRLCLEPFRRRPILSIGPCIAGVPTETIDNSSGIGDIVRHFLSEHGKRRIAYISGPKGNEDAALRLESYRKALMGASIPVRDDLIAYGNFWYNGGEEAIKDFLDVRKVEFDAVVAANDYMAIGAMRELQRRGLRIPTDVAVSGYDDVAEALSTNPALTTVSQPIETQAEIATGHILAGTAPGAPLATELVFRGSCGCGSRTETLASACGIELLEGSLPEANALAALFASQSRFHDTSAIDFLSFAKAFLAALADGAYAPFIGTTFALIAASAERDEKIAEWQNVLSILRAETLPFVPTAAARTAAENAIGKLRVMIGSLAERLSLTENSSDDRFRELLSLSLKNIGRSRTLTELGRCLAQEMPPLGIRSCILLLLSDLEEEGGIKAGPVLPKDRLLTLRTCLVDGTDRTEANAGRTVRVGDFLPLDVIPENRCCDLLAFPIVTDDRFFGIIVYEPGPDDGPLYSTINDQIAVAVQSSLQLIHDVRKESLASERSQHLEQLARPMTDSARDVIGIVEGNAQTVTEMGLAAAETHKEIRRTVDVIEGMSKSVRAMGEFVTVIEDIAASINILGLNAAIEAARSGAAGRGFKVIATEIRALSATTQGNTEKLVQILSEVLKNMDRTVQSGNRSFETFSGLESRIKTLLSSLSDLSSRMGNMAATSKELLELL